LNRAEQLEKDLISLSFSSPLQLSQQPNELSQKQTRRQKIKKNKKKQTFFQIKATREKLSRLRNCKR
jgi:hypothetical protein